MTIDQLIEVLLTNAKSVSDLEETLEGILSFSMDTENFDSGTTALWIQRQQLRRLGNLKIEIRPKEQCHKIPHFHVISPDFEASFTIPDGDQLNGPTPTSAVRNTLKAFFKSTRSKQILIEKWNETRPTDCPIGPISPES